MKDYEKRMVEEHSELKERISKLFNFINSDIYKTLDYDEKLDMSNQLMAMNLYETFLNNRINRFKNN